MSAVPTAAAISRLVLASGSAARRHLLAASGMAFDVLPSGVDETALKLRMRAAGAQSDAVAMALAEAKAVAVSAQREGDLVIGADQILTCGDEWYDKPVDVNQARSQLRALRGRPQVLHTACALAAAGKVVWRCLTQPRLTMRPFSDDVLDTYLMHEGEAACQSVGACRIEGPGYLLFDAVEGEHAAIRGLPLLDLARELRRRLVLPT